ncbi:hypothetical protein E2C01_009027 [Portunus trituberculatus]|uniref:Uncharacterized protein n=1 Tax=Portunus trituberculatus TaxID=210409 RepID=A0A5B7D2C2_PORTR|nr:hypothetical protein [Portunus trituberculatus]
MHVQKAACRCSSRHDGTSHLLARDTRHLLHHLHTSRQTGNKLIFTIGKFRQNATNQFEVFDAIRKTI